MAKMITCRLWMAAQQANAALTERARQEQWDRLASALMARRRPEEYEMTREEAAALEPSANRNHAKIPAQFCPPPPNGNSAVVITALPQREPVRKPNDGTRRRISGGRTEGKHGARKPRSKNHRRANPRARW